MNKSLLIIANSTASNFYNKNAEILHVPFYTITLSALFYIITFVAGCFGNALVIIVVIRNKHLQYNTNYCLINLSVADLLLLCVCMPSSFIELFSEEIWYLGYILCKRLKNTFKIFYIFKFNNKVK